MARKLPRVVLWLFRGSDAELGDVIEEHANGKGRLWVWRQALSTVPVRRRGRIQRQRGTIQRQRGTEMLSNLWSDVRYAMRTFRRNPGFAAAAIVPIALGIGINTGIFSILNALALRPLAAPEATELVSIYQQFQGVQQRTVHGSRSMF